MKFDGWFNALRADGSQPSGYPRNYARERRSMYVLGAVYVVGLIALLITTPPSPVLVVLLPALVAGLLFCAVQLFRLRDLTKERG